MAWFKVDDGFWSHPKTLALSNDAIALWLRSGTWSCQQLTDGFIAVHALAMFGIGSEAVDELVEVGYWENTDGGGYTFHDWDEYQEASEKVKGRRDAARERMKSVRANNERTKSERSHVVRDVFERSSPNPDPTRPDPTRPTYTDQKLVQKKPAHDFDSEFADWWTTYPRKQGKADALKAFKAARKTKPLKTLMDGAQAYALLNIGEEKSYLKLPGGWLRGERWEDEQIVNATKTTTTNQPAECNRHAGYPLPCDRCERDRTENPF